MAIFSLKLLSLLTFLDWTNYGFTWPKDRGTKRLLRDLMDEHGLNRFRHIKDIRGLFHFLKFINPNKRLWSAFLLNHIGYAHWIKKLQESYVFMVKESETGYVSHFDADDIAVVPRITPYSFTPIQGIIKPGEVYSIIPYRYKNKINRYTFDDPDIPRIYVVQRDIFLSDCTKGFIFNGPDLFYDIEIIGTDIETVSLCISPICYLPYMNNSYNRKDTCTYTYCQKECTLKFKKHIHLDFLNKPNGYVGTKKIKWHIRPFRYISNCLTAQPFCTNFQDFFLCILIKRKDINKYPPINIRYKEIILAHLLHKQVYEKQRYDFKIKVNKSNSLDFEIGPYSPLTWSFNLIRGKTCEKLI